MFGVSRQHVSRSVREEQRPVIAGLDAARLRSSVSEAVDAFLADAELGPDDAAMAAVARAFAAKIDALATAETVAVAQAVPVRPWSWPSRSTACALPYGAPTSSTS